MLESIEPDTWLKNSLSKSKEDIKWVNNAYYLADLASPESKKKHLMDFCLDDLKKSNKMSSSYTDGIVTIKATRVTTNNGYMYFVITQLTQLHAKMSIPTTVPKQDRICNRCGGNFPGSLSPHYCM